MESAMAVSTLTSTVTVNAAFLQEIKEVNQELWHLLGELRHRCQRPIAPGSCRGLVEKLSELRDQLALHFALEEAYGYFDDPVDVAPQLCRQAESLKAEHKQLYAQLSDLVERAERMFYDDRHAALAVWLGPEFLDFDARLRRHEERENDLIFEAYDADIGVGD
jgi:hemerythrin-like domain-containing protein